MSSGEVADPSRPERVHSRVVVSWLAAAAIAGPFTILAHELGHFLTGIALGHPDVTLHYASVSSGAADAGVPAWELGLVAASGPLFSLAIVAICTWVAYRHRPYPLVVAAGVIAPVKFVIGIAFLVARLRGAVGGSPNFDGFNAAVHFGISPVWTSLAGALVLVAAWVLLIRSIHPGGRGPPLLGLTVGTGAGIALYLGVVGPWLLP